MTSNPNISYTPQGFRRYGGDRLFALCLLLGLAVTATAVIVVSRHLNERVDLTQLVVVDVKRARVEMAREIAAGPKKAPEKLAKAEPTPAKTRVAPPVVHIKAPPVAIKPPPAIRVKPVPAPPKPLERPAARPAPSVAQPPAAAPSVRPAPGPTAPASSNAGSRLATGATSTMGTTDVGGQGHTQPGTSGAGIGDAAGSGTGAGRGTGADAPSRQPVGDSPKAAPVLPPTPAAPIPVPQVDTPKPPPAPPKPVEKPIEKPPPPPPVIADRAEAQIIGRLPRPEIPAFLSEEGGGGRVTVEFTVKADGTIANVRVTKSDDPRLNNAAKAAARRINARPAIQGGIPRDVTATATFEFRAD